MSVIITGTHTVPLKLTQSGQNPVTVVGTALITTSGAYAIGGSSLLPWSVTNRGTIEDTGSNGVGVSLAGGGTVVNGSAHVTGALISASGAGVVMGAAGVLDNYSKIVGGTVGVDVSGGAASVANFGTITGAGEAGVILAGGGTLMNGSSADTAALVSGNVGISVAGAATVTNYGQIVGTSGTAGLFMGTPNTFVTATLVNGSATDHGASINGGLFTSYSALSIINFGLIGGSIAYTGYTGCGLLNYGMLMGSIYATYVNVTNSGLITGTVASKYELALTNSGTILGDVTVLDARTYIVGDNSGMISGEVNLDSYAATAGFTNSGTVGGGIVMNGYYVSQTLTNTGLIQGGAVLGGLYQGSSISNTGTIVNTNGSGIVLGGNAINELINGSQQATVSGTVGVTFGFYHGTLVNYGTIIGTGGVAVSCAGDALLKIMPGAVFIGTVIGGGGSNTLELASAASAGTLSGLGSSFTGFGTIVADAGAHWSLAGSNSVAGGQVTIGAGAQITAAGGLTLTNGGGVRNSGTVVGTGSGAAALDFTGGGTVTNASGGEVLGVRYAVAIAGGAGYVSNAGLMTATQTTQVSGSPSYVVDLHAGGTVINTGTIAGYQYSNGIYIGGGVGTVTNSGLIESGTGRGSLGNRISKTGVALNGGGIVTNEAGGVIEGSLAGVLLNGAPATLVNSGVIAGGFYSNAGAFVGAKAGGSVLTNNAGAAISGAAFGVQILGANTTLINAGTISGGVAVQLSGTGDRLIVDPGAVFLGVVSNVAAGNTLELASAASAGTLTALGTSFTNFGTVVVDAGAHWTLAGSNSIASGETVSLGSGATLTVAGTVQTGMIFAISGAGSLGVLSAGVLSVGAGVAASGVITVQAGYTLSGSGRLTSAVRDSGSVIASGGTLSFSGALGGLGGLTIDPNSVASLRDALTVKAMNFLTPGSGTETLALGSSIGNSAVISGFGTGATIDLLNVVATSPTFARGVLTLSTGGGVATLHFAGSYSSAQFLLASDHHNGTNITFV